MTEELNPVSWARVWAAVKPSHSRNLRAGTWYPVVRDERPDRVTLEVGGTVVDVPRRMLEIRPRRPKEFSVVYGKRRPSMRTEGESPKGPSYAVCPLCGKRFEVARTAPWTQCVACGHKADIDW